jgi:hypothetical protein
MRYGSFQYGNGTKYGLGVYDTQLWGLLVDWNGDGLYEYANEAAALTDVQIRRGRKYLLNASGTDFEPVDTGILTVELDNSDGRFNPNNEDSPLWPYVRPGIKIQLITRSPGSSDITAVFTGRIDNILPISGTYERVKFVAKDGTGELDQDIDLTLQTSIPVDDFISAVLDASAWPWDRDLETSTDTIAYAWAPSDKTAIDIAREVANAYLGNFFIGADGKAKFYNRSHDLGSALLRIEQNHVTGNIVLQTPWEVIKNDISIIAHPRSVQSNQVVWALSDVPTVAPGETYDVWGTFSANGAEVPISTYTVPAATTDYKVYTNADGTGTNLTASCAVTVTVYANTVRYQLKNNHATLTGYITLMQLRGTPLISSDVKVLVTDSASQALYGKKQLVVDSVYLQNTNFMPDLATALQTMLADPQKYPTFQVTARPDIQYTLDLFDLVDLDIPASKISGTYRVAYIEHRWVHANGQTTLTTYSFEPVNNPLGTVWTFPAQIGIDTIFSF